MMNAACPLCRSGDTFVLQKTEPLGDSDPLVMTAFIAAGETLKFVVCQVCSLVFRSPRPTPELTANYYEHVLPSREPAYMEAMGISREQKDARNDRRYALLFQDLSRLVPGKTGHVIDIGGWDGRSLLPWQSAGWETTLIDPGAAKRALAAPNIHALGSVAEAIHAKLPPATLITSYHCVEHMTDIDQWMSESKHLSKPNTIWSIEVPFELIYIRNLLQPRPLNGVNIHDQHLNFFTPRSLRVLGLLMGLEPMSVKIVITPYWFGPTVSLRMIARASSAQTQPAPLRPSSARGVRASLALLLPVWRRIAGLKLRYSRLTHPEFG